MLTLMLFSKYSSSEKSNWKREKSVSVSAVRFRLAFEELQTKSFHAYSFVFFVQLIGLQNVVRKANHVRYGVRLCKKKQISGLGRDLRTKTSVQELITFSMASFFVFGSIQSSEARFSLNASRICSIIC